MGDKTAIQWTDATWNPLAAFDRVTGKRGWFCTRVSEGCKHCYAAAINKRLGTGHDYQVPNLPKIEWRLVNLDQPLRWKRPRRIFVNSMTDLFHEDVPDELIEDVFFAMGSAVQHTFQVLTKRADRMLEFIAARLLSVQPLPNVWLGVSVENQERADERIPYLLQTPAAVRFLSCEPLLEEVMLGFSPINPTAGAGERQQYRNYLPGIDWVIVGGESGSGARHFDVAWAMSIIAQCRGEKVPCMVKQLGSKPGAWIRSRSPSAIAGRSYHQLKLKDKKGGDWSEWPEHLRVREFPRAVPA